MGICMAKFCEQPEEEIEERQIISKKLSQNDNHSWINLVPSNQISVLINDYNFEHSDIQFDRFNNWSCKSETDFANLTIKRNHFQRTNTLPSYILSPHFNLNTSIVPENELKQIEQTNPLNQTKIEQITNDKNFQLQSNDNHINNDKIPLAQSTQITNNEVVKSNNIDFLNDIPNQFENTNLNNETDQTNTLTDSNVPNFFNFKENYSKNCSNNLNDEKELLETKTDVEFNKNNDSLFETKEDNFYNSLFQSKTDKVKENNNIDYFKQDNKLFSKINNPNVNELDNKLIENS